MCMLACNRLPIWIVNSLMLNFDMDVLAAVGKIKLLAMKRLIKSSKFLEDVQICFLSSPHSCQRSISVLSFTHNNSVNSSPIGSAFHAKQESSLVLRALQCLQSAISAAHHLVSGVLKWPELSWIRLYPLYAHFCSPMTSISIVDSYYSILVCTFVALHDCALVSNPALWFSLYALVKQVSTWYINIMVY